MVKNVRESPYRWWQKVWNICLNSSLNILSVISTDLCIEVYYPTLWWSCWCVFVRQLCLTGNNFADGRHKRDTVQALHPIHIALATIRKNLTNTPPRLLTDAIKTNEDENLTVDLQWEDDESDGVTFTLVKPPLHGHVELLSNGTLHYIPSENFYGNESLTVHLDEHIAAVSNSTSYTVPYTVKVEVVDQNDAPLVYFGMEPNTTYNTKVQNSIRLLLEANVSHYDIGSVVTCDLDLIDSLKVQTRDPKLHGTTFLFTEVYVIPHFLDEIVHNTSTRPNHIRSFHLQMNLTSYAFGLAKYGILTSDEHNWFSKPAWFEIYILINPCVYGHCESKDGVNKTCQDTSRAFSFDDFLCECAPGYHGSWCQIEIDECLPQPCPLMYDCVDQLNSYACNINPAKLLAILVCLALALAVAIFFVKRIRARRQRSYKVNHSL